MPMAIYNPTEINLVVPVVNSANEIPAAKICGVELVYKGKFVSCVQSEIELFQRFVFFSHLLPKNIDK